jgi:prepilin-type N-terminal cleavage/methylation domain-containing protein
MIKIKSEISSQKSEKRGGFTLIETLVALAILSIAVVAPMSLVAQSLTSSLYARDQVTAFFLAQEALEAVHNIRDHNILLTSFGTPTDLMSTIPTNDTPFVIDTRNNVITLCGGVCPVIKEQLNPTLYGHGTNPTDLAEPGWKPTRFTRTTRVKYAKNPDNSDNLNEIIITVSVSWRSGSLPVRTFTLSQNLYRWIDDTI